MSGKGVQQKFEEAGLGVAVEFRFVDPDVAVGEGGRFGRLPQVEIHQQGAVGELVLDARFQEASFGSWSEAVGAKRPRGFRGILPPS